MKSIISVVIGTIILFPFLITVVYLIAVKKMGKAPIRVVGRAADMTTPFLFLAVYVIAYTLFGDGSGWYITGIAIIIAIIMAILVRLNVKEFQIIRLLQRIWRLYFLLLASAYLALLVLGIILNIVEYVN